MALGISGGACIKTAGQLGTPMSQTTQCVSGTGLAATSVATSALGAQAPGAVNIVFVGCSIAGDITSVTDSNGNTYTPCVNYLNNPVAQTNGLFNLYAYQTTIGVELVATAGNVVTVNFSTGLNSFVFVGEYPNVGVVAQHTQSATGTTTGSTVTTYVNNTSAVLITCAIGDGTGTPTPGGVFTAQVAGSTTAMAYIVEDQLITSYATGNAGVACAATAVANTTWTTIALSLIPAIVPKTVNSPGGSVFNGTLCLFICEPTLQSSSATVLTWVGNFDNGGWSLLVTSGNVLEFQSAALVTLVANTWYFVAITIAGAGARVVTYVKKVGAPTCTRTVQSALTVSGSSALVQLCIGSNGNTTNGGSQAETFNQGLVASLRSLFFYPNQVLSQAEIDRQSESLSPVRRPGLAPFFSFVDSGHQPTFDGGFVDESGGSTLLLDSYVNGGTLSTSAEPPLLEGVNIARRKFAKMRSSDVLFFNGPFVSSGEAATLQSDMNPLAQYRRERRPPS